MCERAARQLGHARAQASAKPSPLWWGNWKRVTSDIIRSAGILLFGPSLFAIFLRLSSQFAMVVDLKIAGISMSRPVRLQWLSFIFV